MISLRLFQQSVLMMLCVLASSAFGEEWRSWRGPYGTGRIDGDYPTEWSAEKNVVWKIEMPSRAGSTPVFVGDKIFLTTSLENENGVLCLDLKGQELWRQTIGDAVPGKHKKASASNPSPITDGKQLFVYYKSGDLAALNLDGKVLWQKNLQDIYGEDTLWWDLGTSPVLTDDHVVIACMQSPPSPSYLAAFDKSKGQQAWKVERELGAPEEAAQSYATPTVVEYEGETQIVVLGADYVTCHSAEDGHELWRVGTLNPEQERFFRSISSAVVTAGIVIAPYARGNSLTAIRMGGKGNVTDTHVLWSKQAPSADVPTPAAQDGKVYVCDDRGQLTCLEAESGKELWSVETPKNRLKFSASPILAGRYLYLLREDATCFVVDTEKRQLVATNELGGDEFVVSSPAFHRGRVYLRTFEHLYCIGR